MSALRAFIILLLLAGSLLADSKTLREGRGAFYRDLYELWRQCGRSYPDQLPSALARQLQEIEPGTSYQAINDGRGFIIGNWAQWSLARDEKSFPDWPKVFAGEGENGVARIGAACLYHRFSRENTLAVFGPPSDMTSEGSLVYEHAGQRLTLAFTESGLTAKAAWLNEHRLGPDGSWPRFPGKAPTAYGPDTLTEQERKALYSQGRPWGKLEIIQTAAVFLRRRFMRRDIVAILGGHCRNTPRALSYSYAPSATCELVFQFDPVNGYANKAWLGFTGDIHPDGTVTPSSKDNDISWYCRPTKRDIQRANQAIQRDYAEKARRFPDKQAEEKAEKE